MHLLEYTLKGVYLQQMREYLLFEAVLFMPIVVCFVLFYVVSVRRGVSFSISVERGVYAAVVAGVAVFMGLVFVVLMWYI